jgi:hypothetical protein
VERRDPKYTLMFFYAYLLDELQLQRLSQHSPMDLLAVWGGPQPP